MNYEPNLGIYDMRRDTTGLPSSLANRININVCNKGGGGGTTVTGGLGPTLDPLVADILTGAISDSKARKEAGPYATVADMTPQQKEALAQQTNISKQKIAGTGIYDDTKAQESALQKTLGNLMGQSSSGQTLGSARTQAAIAGTLADEADKFGVKRRKVVDEGIRDLGMAGTTQQKFNQSLQDARFTEDQRTAGLITGTAPKQQTTTGGGK